MQTFLNLPETLDEDLDRFQREIEKFMKEEISAAEFRAFRVPQGVYEQRENGTYMLRVRFPAGGVLPHQMRKLASVSRDFGNGVLHLTTRQDIQVHRVKLEAIHPALVDLYGSGLSTKGGGGNTVRNITACLNAGVCPEEEFDVGPYAVALTEFMLPDPLSYQLPRKYKIAFSGCSCDCTGATLNDVGFIARKRGEMEGFAVHVGGGMGAFSRVADLLEDFIPTTEIHYVAEAVKRVFDKHGNRKNRNKARLRFLIEEIGLEQFRRLYQCELEDLRKQGLGCLDVRPLPKTPRSVPPEEVSPANGFEKWRINNISPQMQEDFYLVHIPLALGDIPADTIEKLANVVENCGEGSIRTTQCQNIALRWVHEKELPSLHKDLKDLGIVDSPPPIIRNMIACAGASTCRLGICLSRGLADALTEKLAASDLDLDELGGMSVHISGCPNACGRHPAATIGFYGAARRKGGSLAPHYIVQLGGRVQEGETQLARGRDAIPAWRVPAFTVDLLKAFQTSDEYPNYQTFLDNGGREVAGGLAAKYRNIPSIEEDESCYRDWGAGELFSLAGRGPGECSAGVFDLIKVDLASAREALENGRPYAATVSASRALLVTTGKEAKGDTDALEGFAAHFIDSELVDESLRDLIEKGCAAATGDNPEDTFAGEESEVAALIETVETLYENMDASLRFKPSKVCR